MAGPKIAAVQNQDLSVLLPYSALILCSSTLAILFVCIALERWLLRRLYGSVWQTLLFGESEERRRSFACLNAGLVINLIVFLIGLYPTFDFLVGRGDLSAPLSTKKDGVTIGDILFILAQLYGANYLFDLCFRAGLARAMGIAHHIGVLIILETSLSLFANLTEYPEATLQFYMCMVWATFDVITGLPICCVRILWRAKSYEGREVARMAYGCFVWVVVGATVEVAVTTYLWCQSWSRWGLAWRVVNPMVFALWISTQIYGSFRLFQKARRVRKQANGELG